MGRCFSQKAPTNICWEQTSFTDLMEDIKGVNFKMVSLYLLPVNVLGVCYKAKTRLTLLDLIFCHGGHQIGLQNHTPAQPSFFSGGCINVWSVIVCVCVCCACQNNRQQKPDDWRSKEQSLPCSASSSGFQYFRAHFFPESTFI